VSRKTLIFGEQPQQWLAARRLGISRQCRRHSSRRLRLEAIHAEPTGYADFAARFEAARLSLEGGLADARVAAEQGAVAFGTYLFIVGGRFVISLLNGQ
jgi:hypothetical protein